jgi:hypothetical protein
MKNKNTRIVFVTLRRTAAVLNCWLFSFYPSKSHKLERGVSTCRKYSLKEGRIISDLSNFLCKRRPNCFKRSQPFIAYLFITLLERELNACSCIHAVTPVIYGAIRSKTALFPIHVFVSVPSGRRNPPSMSSLNSLTHGPHSG